MAFIRGANVVTDGLVLALDAANPKSYPRSGTTWSDLSGTSVTGSLVNGPTFNSTNGGSIQFDGVDDYVSLGNILNIGTGQFSLEIFANASAMTSDFAKVASKGVYQAGGWRIYFGRYLGNYSIAFQYGNNIIGDLSLFGSTADVGVWYHIIATRNSTNTLSIYINGEFKNSKTETFDFSTSNNYTIGANTTNSEYFKGNVALYRHYNRGLSAQEVLQNYNATKARFGIQ